MAAVGGGGAGLVRVESGNLYREGASQKARKCILDNTLSGCAGGEYFGPLNRRAHWPLVPAVTVPASDVVGFRQNAAVLGGADRLHDRIRKDVSGGYPGYAPGPQNSTLEGNMNINSAAAMIHGSDLATRHLKAVAAAVEESPAPEHTEGLFSRLEPLSGLGAKRGSHAASRRSGHGGRLPGPP